MSAQSQSPESEIVHLAIHGTTSYEVFGDLCQGSPFDAVILFETTTFGLNPSGDNNKGTEYLHYSRGEYQGLGSVDERFNTWVGTTLKGSREADRLLPEPRLPLRFRSRDSSGMYGKQ